MFCNSGSLLEVIPDQDSCKSTVKYTFTYTFYYALNAAVKTILANLRRIGPVVVETPGVGGERRERL